jgi:hypothetical protein
MMMITFNYGIKKKIYIQPSAAYASLYIFLLKNFFFVFFFYLKEKKNRALNFLIFFLDI